MVAPLLQQTSQNVSNVNELVIRESETLKDIDAVDVAWNRIVELFQGPSNHVSNLDGIKQVMRKEYTTAPTFSKDLFIALRNCLDEKQLIFHLPDKTGEKDAEDFPIIFKYGVERQTTFPQYAIGICRGANAEQKEDDDEKLTSKSTTTSNGLAPQARIDHGTCLLRRERHGTWSVVACLSAVKLNISNSSNFATFNVVNNRVQKFGLMSNPGGVTQVMMYTVGWVLPSLGRIGQLGEQIPWSVIVAKKTLNAAAAAQVQTRAVSGNIFLPKASGDRLTFAVTGYARRAEGGHDTDESILEQAISIYFETLRFGLNVAKCWMDSSKPVTPNHTSGQKVMIGGQELADLTLRGSSLFGNKFRGVDSMDVSRWKINQGEIFTGKVNIRQLQENLTKRQKSEFLVFTKLDQEVDVVVKVSSVAVHKYLVHPDQSFPALQKIHANNVDLSDVLYAVYHKPLGLITIMADLSSPDRGYHDLKPIDLDVPLPILWEGFKRLVTNVLLGMAEVDCIHPDIRPGYDVTANILVRIEQAQATMHLIDFESVVVSSKWTPPSSDNANYIVCDSGWTAETFVCWQCIAVAYAWMEGKSQSEMAKINLKSMLSDEAAAVTIRGTWLEKFREPATIHEMEASHVEHVLEVLDKDIRDAEVCRQAEMERQAKVERQAQIHPCPKRCKC